MADKNGILLRIKSQYILNNVTSFVNKFVLYNLRAFHFTVLEIRSHCCDYF